ncbi:MAG: sodium/proton-translocating pyrophosphatase, partial [Proteobacteria bacterium]|nr:sodium/proton-translocating pyrophosphatase [Pseudomonadota bacterium]
GSVMGLCVASLGLLGLSVLYYLYGSDPETAHAIHGFGMGASSVALFSRVGGGIFTKCADVGADLVGKIEAGIPEDDPRNPGVIADNVGDNVGDVAGMGSDIFESYCGAIIATIAIATTMTPAALVLLSDGEDFERAALMALPLALAAAGLLSSIVSIALVRLSTHVGQPPSAALRIGTIASTVIVMAMAYLLIQTTFDIHINVWFTVIVGAVGGILIGLSTEYYTSSHPVRRIAESGETGSATVIITGLAIGFQSVVPAVLVIAGVIFLSTWLAGLYGVAIAAVGMLSTVGMTMAIDAYGPIADNAGGIAEMSGMGKETRKITDSLDALGNTTAAIGKGFAISAAALAALAIIAAFVEVLRLKYPGFTIDIANPDVLVGLFLGGVIPFF